MEKMYATGVSLAPTAFQSTHVAQEQLVYCPVCSVNYPNSQT